MPQPDAMQCTVNLPVVHRPVGSLGSQSFHWSRARFMRKPCGSAIVLGATVSPTWFHANGRQQQVLVLFAVWHLACCPACRLVRLVCRDDALLRRFGWLYMSGIVLRSYINRNPQVQQMIWDIDIGYLKVRGG